MATNLEFDDFDQFWGLIYAQTGNWLGDSKTTFFQVRQEDALYERGMPK
jgi:hypothetical protein